MSRFERQRAATDQGGSGRFGSNWTRSLKQILHSTFPYLLLLGAYVLILRDIVFARSLIITPDLVLPATIPYLHWTAFYSVWTPYGLGLSGYPNWAGGLTGVFVLISQGNQLYSQKLMLTHILLASFSMFYVTKQLISQKLSVGISCALLFAYGPVTFDNFGSQILWGYAMLPLVVLLLVRMVTNARTYKYPILLAACLAVASSWLPQILPAFPFVAVAVSLPFVARKADQAYLLHLSKSITLFVISLVTMLAGSYAWLIFSGQGGAVSFSPPSIANFYANYQSLEPSLLVRLAGLGSSAIHPVQWTYISPNAIGFIFPILAFAAIATKPRSALSLGAAFLAISVIGFVQSIRIQSPLAEAFYLYYPGGFALRDPLILLMLLYLAYALLIGITADFIATWLLHTRLARQLETDISFSKTDRTFSAPTGKLLKRIKKSLGATVVLTVVLIPVFLYVPSYSVSLHNSTPAFPNPQVFGDMIGWMKQQGADGSFRYLVVPTTHVTMLNIQNTYPYFLASPSGASTPQSHTLTNRILDRIVKGDTNTIGALLALANVKYMVIVKLTHEPNYLNWTVQGPIRRAGDFIVGDPKYFESFALRQADLVPIVSRPDFEVFQNINYIPHITAFGTSVHVLGHADSVATLSLVPNATVTETLLTFGKSNSSSELDIASSVVFHNQPAQVVRDTAMRSRPSFLIWDDNYEGLNRAEVMSTYQIASFDDTDGTTILAGTGTLSANFSSKVEGVASILYTGNSSSDSLFSILHEPGVPIDVTAAAWVRFHVRLTNASMNNNLEFGLIDSNQRFRRWYKELLPTIPLGKWTEVAIDINSFSTQEQDFDLRHVQSFQFATYSSSPLSSLSLQIDALETGFVELIRYNVAASVPEEGIYFAGVLSSDPGSDPSVSVGLESQNLTNATPSKGYYALSAKEPFYLSRGVQNVTVSMRNGGTLKAVFVSTIPDFSDILGARKPKPTVKEVSQTGPASYLVRVDIPEIAFLTLGESYDDGWVASYRGLTARHFVAFSFANGFHLETKGEVEITITQAKQNSYLLLVSATTIATTAFPLSISLWPAFAKRRLRLNA